jgi:geranylgeranylglycerol-phosphate geranylgeranyltransferase
VILALYLCNPDLIISKNFILAAIAASLSAASGNIINDIFDRDADAINKPEKPLPSGRVTMTAAINFYIIVLLASIFISFSINQIAFLTVVLSDILLFLYSLRLKRIPFLGNFAISFLTGFVFLYGGMIAGDIKSVLIPAGFAFLINLSREGIKAIEDIPGDKRAGVITFPLKYGINFSKIIISSFLILLLIFTFVPVITGYYGIGYLVIIIIIIDPLLLYVVKSLNETNRNMNLKRLSLILKLNMVVGLIAIFLGK